MMIAGSVRGTMTGTEETTGADAMTQSTGIDHAHQTAHATIDAVQDRLLQSDQGAREVLLAHHHLPETAELLCHPKMNRSGER